MENNSNLSKTKPAFRTSGAVTGNFGAGKRKGGSKLTDIPANRKDSIGNFPTQSEYAERLRSAYHATSDEKLKAFIVKELGKIERSSIHHGERVSDHPRGPHCDLKNYFIKSFH
jgi:hypothetical protein